MPAGLELGQSAGHPRRSGASHQNRRNVAIRHTEADSELNKTARSSPYTRLVSAPSTTLGAPGRLGAPSPRLARGLNFDVSAGLIYAGLAGRLARRRTRCTPTRTQTPSSGLPGGVHDPALPPERGGGPAPLAHRPRWVSRPRCFRREEGPGPRHRRGMGPVPTEPGAWLVRAAEGLPGSIRDVPSATARGARTRRAHTPVPQQPDSRRVNQVDRATGMRRLGRGSFRAAAVETIAR